jgi:hypothetical protein
VQEARTVYESRQHAPDADRNFSEPRHSPVSSPPPKKPVVKSKAKDEYGEVK